MTPPTPATPPHRPIATWPPDRMDKAEQNQVVFNMFLEGLEESIEELKAGQKAHDKRFDKIEAQLKTHDKRFDQHDKRFDEHDKRFDTIDAQLKAHDKRFDVIDGKLDLLVDLIKGDR